jgi:hypothetical protein
MNDALTPDDLPPDQHDRLCSLLPWYVNNTLAGPERDWVDALVARSHGARLLLAQENIFRSRAALLAEVPAPLQGDLGLARLLHRVRHDMPVRAQPVASRVQPATGGLWRALKQALAWLTQPRMASAMAVVLVVQAGVIGWMGQHDLATEYDESRGVAVQEARTLRVRFKGELPEREVRKALNAAGARIVSGPNQLGEYWLASDLVSLDEMKSRLISSGVTEQVEVDTQGPPRGQK